MEKNERNAVFIPKCTKTKEMIFFVDKQKIKIADVE